MSYKIKRHSLITIFSEDLLGLVQKMNPRKVRYLYSDVRGTILAHLLDSQRTGSSFSEFHDFIVPLADLVPLIEVCVDSSQTHAHFMRISHIKLLLSRQKCRRLIVKETMLTSGDVQNLIQVNNSFFEFTSNKAEIP